MRAFFIGHGSPMIALEQNEYVNFLQQFGEKVEKPEAIIIFTAHWESEILTISDVPDTYDTIYDFYGFPKELYELEYPAKGHPDFVKKLTAVLAKHKVTYQIDRQRGLDHGSWVPLYIMFPDADIPVIQCTVNPFGSVKEHYNIGAALAELADENIMVIGSGATVHNLRTLQRYVDEVAEWPKQFDDWLLQQVENWDIESLNAYESLAPYATLAVPRAEHFLPFFVPMGCGHKKKSANIHYRWYQHHTLSYLFVEFEV